MIIIDLSGPEGNAFSLMGKVKVYGKQLEMEKSEIDAIIDEMKEGDYNDLLDVFENHFGEYVLLQNKPFEWDEDIWDDEIGEKNLDEIEDFDDHEEWDEDF